MAHPKMYADDDKYLLRMREICADLPEFHEVEAWGHPTFRAGKKMFAAYGGEYGTPALGVKVGFDRQDELLRDKRFFPTPYAAHQGWVSLTIDGKTDWKMVAGLLLEAYRQVALKRMLIVLDGSAAEPSKGSGRKKASGK
jgi:predicted DNA-binding protein (MmcQ/YjbR family)